MSVKSELKVQNRFSIEEQIEIVRKRMFQEKSWKEIRSEYQISDGTLCNWMKKHKAEVLRREIPKGLPLYVRKYVDTMEPSEEQELDRLKRENAELKLIQQTWETIARLSLERFGVDLKKNFEEMQSGKLETPPNTHKTQ